MSPPERREARPWLPRLPTRVPATCLEEAKRPPGGGGGLGVGGVCVWGGQGLGVVFARTPGVRVRDQSWERSGLFVEAVCRARRRCSGKRLCGVKRLCESVTNVTLSQQLLWRGPA